jgi:hypothetical protein
MIVGLIDSRTIASVSLAALACHRNVQTRSGQSKFMAHASPSGLLWFKGHTHHLASS